VPGGGRHTVDLKAKHEISSLVKHPDHPGGSQRLQRYGIKVPGFPTETALPQPFVTLSSVPSVDEALKAYLDAFNADDYNKMYSLLSKVSQDANPLENFALRNRDALNVMSASSFDYEVLSSLVNPYSAEVAYRVTYHTALVGDISDMVARYTLENGNGIELGGWSHPSGSGGNVLQMDYSVPARGNIYDRNGDALAAQTTAYAFEIIPGNVTEDSRGTLLSEVWNLCGISMEALDQEILNTPAQFAIPLWRHPIRIPANTLDCSQRTVDRVQLTLLLRTGCGSTSWVTTDRRRKSKYRRLGYRGDGSSGGMGSNAGRRTIFPVSTAAFSMSTIQRPAQS
jgi:hypothetical protein